MHRHYHGSHTGKARKRNNIENFYYQNSETFESHLKVKSYGQLKQMCVTSS